ncbi:MAG: winged helix-turn-helix domain-containing protein [Caulobacteraceae bacterium]
MSLAGVREQTAISTDPRRLPPRLLSGGAELYRLLPSAAVEAAGDAAMDDLEMTPAARRVSLAHEPAARLGALNIDPASRRVVHDDGREEFLEPRVMQVLVTLLRADGRILSRDELLDTCWPGVLVGEDALNRVMGRLRRLAGGVGAEAFKIETVTKVGYRLVRLGEPAPRRPAPAAAPETTRAPSICVLPFINMSDDPQQEYFSDGVSEDITTDLSKVSSLFVVARTTAFAYRGKTFDVAKVAQDLSVSHVLEGSVRKADGRVRITAQLIDGVTGGHVWAERYDRELKDIFALQAEISEAIVGALTLKLLPEEKAAIAQSDTSDVEAYSLFLMARQYYESAREGDERALEAIERLCSRATEIDPGYARAWTLLGIAQTWRHSEYGLPLDGGVPAIERALALDDRLADAHAFKARHLWKRKRFDEAFAEIDIALALDPQSWAANAEAGRLHYSLNQFEPAARFYDKASKLPDSAKGDSGMLLSSCAAIGDEQGMRSAAEMAVLRAEEALASNHVNGAAMGCAVSAFAVMGQVDKARDLIRRALLIDPDNLRMRFNFACGSMTFLKDPETALGLLGPAFEAMTPDWLEHVAIDPDLDPLRGDPRFKAMLAAAQARLASAG